MTQAIFLSYASQDADAARRICEALRSAGLEIWFDQSELRGGDAWDASIRKQIKECALFVPLISDNTNAREEGYFRLEWKLAVDRSHLMADDKTFFVPVILGDTPEPTARVPDAFRTRQWSRLNDDQAIAAFAIRVAKLVAGRASPSINARNAAPVLAVEYAVEASPTRSPDGAAFSPGMLKAGGTSGAGGNPGIVANQATPRITPEKASGSMTGYKTALLIAAAIATVATAAFFIVQYFASANNTKPIESIAVMPFVNASGNAEFEYLSDGMTETLIGTLSQLPKLSVKARSSVFRYKGKDTNPQTIGRELSVQAVLNGRLVQRGDDIALSLELVEVQKENVIWSEQYNRKKADLVTLQTEIARDVSGKLKTKLSGADSAKVAKIYTANPEAYQLYLKGRFFWNKRTAESLLQAEALFKQAIEKDPGYALAYSGLAETYALFSAYRVMSGLESYPKAKAAALRALELDDSLAEAHAALAIYLGDFERNRTEAEKQYRRAIELNPKYATAHHWYGMSLGIVKRFDEALVELKIAESLDPLSPIIGTNLGDTLYYARRFDEAIAQYQRVLRLNENFGYAHGQLGKVLHVKKMFPEAIAAFRKAIQLQSPKEAQLAISLLKIGQRDQAVNLLDELKRASVTRYVPRYNIAIVALALGDKEDALAWLEKDMADQSPTSSEFAVDPYLDELHNEPRFKAMLKQLNLPE